MDTLFTPQKYLDAFIKTAQYLASLTSQQDYWSEIGKTVIHFFGADLAGFAERLADGEVEGHDWILPEEVSYESVFTGKTKDRINDVLESGFFSVHQIHTPDQYSLVILPIRQENLSTTVLMIGYRMSGPIPKELLNVYMAVAGLVRITITELSSRARAKRIEEELRKSNAEKKAILDSIVDMVSLKDRDYRFIWVNEAVAETVGLAVDEIEGRICYEVSFDREEPCEGCLFQRTLETGKVVRGEATYTDGRPREVIVGPILDDSGCVVAAVELSRDITDRKRMEEELREHSEHLEEMVEQRTEELRDAQEELVRQEKLAVLGQLAGGVGHELRNPLGAIKNAAYFLNMALEEPEPEVKETLEILEKEVDTSERIISSLLDFARAKPPIRRKVEISDVLQEALSRVATPENIEVVSQLDETLPTIMADPDQLGQVFDGIVLNAIQAMPEGGRLTIKSESINPERIEISIADTGTGIPEENLERIFEPLFTTKAKGIGLGLPIAKTVVEGHGGAIEVESTLGKGSTFTVKLPTRGE